MTLSLLLYATMVCSLAAFVGMLVADAVRSRRATDHLLRDAARTRHRGAPRIRETYRPSRAM
jgi:hypothetical protein